jgi:ankyrin repeat protein
MVKTFIELATDVNSADFLGRTPLHLAAQFGNTAVAKLLIENGADVNEVEQDGLTPLHYACKKGDPELLHLLIDRGANVNAMSKNGWTPFWLLNSDEVPESLEGVVMIKQKEECCKILIDSGATTNEEGNI